jgi:hypothetical protein
MLQSYNASLAQIRATLFSILNDKNEVELTLIPFQWAVEVLPYLTTETTLS